jgi:2-dehydropantoate 2-reductase
MLEIAGFRVEEHVDISLIQWKKLIINAVINPLTAVLGLNNGELISNRYAYDLLRTLTNETVSIAEDAGVSLDADMLHVICDVINRTGSNQSSMLQDRQRGAPTEIEAINGYLLRIAEVVGNDASLNRSLVLMVKAMTPEHPK